MEQDINVKSHLSVLLSESVEGLAIKEGGIYIDGTFGRGGHSQAILHKLGSNGHLMAIDKDPEAIEMAQQQFANDGRFSIKHGSFAQLKEFVEEKGWLGQVDGILLDLGVSSPQIDDAERGFSFKSDGPLDMRMDHSSGVSAAEWLATVEEAELAKVLWVYGEERFSRRIARAVVREREKEPLTTTRQLAELVADAVPKRERGKDPATRSFQAIRIYINRELDDLRDVLEQVMEVLAIGGRVAVISFHSLEDRIVKRYLRGQSRSDVFPKDLPVMESMIPKANMKLIGKAIKASKDELAVNVRARSAVLRIAERLS